MLRDHVTVRVTCLGSGCDVISYRNPTCRSWAGESAPPSGAIPAARSLWPVQRPLSVGRRGGLRPGDGSCCSQTGVGRAARRRRPTAVRARAGRAVWRPRGVRKFPDPTAWVSAEESGRGGGLSNGGGPRLSEFELVPACHERGRSDRSRDVVRWECCGNFYSPAH